MENQIIFKVVTEPKELEKIFRLRYIVNAKYEYIQPNGSERESDLYDQFSTHIGAYYNGELIGTMRIITQSEYGFPMEKEFELFIPEDYIDKTKFAEISRLNVNSLGDNKHQVMLGLIKTAKDICLSMGIYICYFAVDSRVFRLFSRIQLGFIPMGEERLYMGSMSVPAFVDIRGWLKYLEVTNSRLYNFFAGGDAETTGFEWYSRGE